MAQDDQLTSCCAGLAAYSMAGQRWQADPSSVYTGAVLAALQWVVGANPTAGRPAAPPPIRGAIRGANYR